MSEPSVPRPTIENRRILITGGMGFVGAWLTQFLAGHGNEIVLYDGVRHEQTTGAALGVTQLPGVKLVQGDIMDGGQLAALGQDFDFIVHTAALLGIQYVTSQPLPTLDVNIGGTHRVLELARSQKHLERFITFSTSEVYGASAVRVREEDPIQIGSNSMRWCYAASKAANEFYAKAYLQQYATPIVIVRPFNVYGPHRFSPNAMTTFIKNAIAGEELVVSGDGSQSRAWCFVTDFVDGLIRCLVHPRAVGETFNLGNEEATLSIVELARKVVALTGSSSKVRLQPTSAPDVQARLPSIERARRVLGFNPEVGIDAGIVRAAESFRSVARRPAAAVTGT